MADVATMIIEVDPTSAERTTTALKGMTEAGRTAEAQILNLEGAFKILAGSLIVREVAEFSKELVMLGARYETLGATLSVMGANVGKTRVEMDALQLGLEKTGISALRARGGLQIMAAAQVDLAGSSALGRVAQDAATLANINSSEAFNNLIRGISTGESRIIRHMGIMVNFKTAIDAYARANNVAASSLTSTESSQIRMNAVLEEGRKRAGVYEAAMTTAGKQLLSMERYTENLKIQLGETFNSATNVVVFAMATALKEASLSMKEWAASGDQAVFASDIADKVQRFISTLKTASTFVREHITAVEAMAIAYGSVKLAGFIQSMLQSIQAIKAKALASQEANVAAIRGEMAESQARLLNIETIAAEFRAQQALTWHQFKSNAAKESDILLQRAVNAELMRAVELNAQLAIAQSAAAAGASTFKSVISGLGGPIGIAIMLLGLLALAYEKVRDKSTEKAKDLDLAISQRIEQIKREKEQQQRVLDAMLGGASTEEAQTATFRAEEQPLAVNALKLRAEMTGRLKEAEDALAVTEKQASINRTGFDSEQLSAAKNRVATAQADHAAAIQRSIDIVNEEQGLKDLQNRVSAVQMVRAARYKQATPEEREKSQSAYLNSIATLNEQIIIQQNKMFGYSQEYEKSLKIQADYTREIAKLNAVATDGKISSEQRAHKAELLELLRDTSLAALGYAEATKRQTEEIVRQQQPIQDMSKYLTDLEQKTTEFGMSAEDLAVNKLKKLKDSTQLTTDAYEAMYERLIKLITLTREQKEDARLISEGNALNKRKADDDDALSHLNRIAAVTKLLPGVYQKAWTEIMMKGDSAMAYMVQGMTTASHQMEEAFVKFATTGKFSFKEMTASILADLARMMAQKAFVQLLEFGIGMLMSSAGNSMGGNLAGSTSGSGAGSFNAGGTGGSSGLGYAYGGSVMSGKPIMVGERGPELFVPPSSGGIVPNNQLGGGLVVNNYLTIMPDGSSSKHSEGGASRGSALGDSLFEAMNQWAVIQRRPNGLLDMNGTR